MSHSAIALTPQMQAGGGGGGGVCVCGGGGGGGYMEGLGINYLLTIMQSCVPDLVKCAMDTQVLDVRIAQMEPRAEV